MREYSTKRLVIAVSIFLMVLILGFIFMKKGDLAFAKTTQQTIDYLSTADYQISPEIVARNIKAGEKGYVYVDLRNPYEFAIGNLPGSVNIPQTELLSEKALGVFTAAQNQDETVVLIGNDEATTTGPWLILEQLGYNNLKVMQGGWEYLIGKKSHTGDLTSAPAYMVEEPAYDYSGILKLMQAEPSAAGQNGGAPEIVVPMRKTKKGAVEGGC